MSRNHHFCCNHKLLGNFSWCIYTLLGSLYNVFPIYRGIIFFCQCSSFFLQSKNAYIWWFGDSKVPPDVNEWCVSVCGWPLTRLGRTQAAHLLLGCDPECCLPSQEWARWIICKRSVKGQRGKCSLERRGEARGKLVGVLAVIITICSLLHLMHASLHCGPPIVTPAVSLTLPWAS